MDHPQPDLDVPLARPVPGVPYARLVPPRNPLHLLDLRPADALLDAGLVVLTAIAVHYVPQMIAHALGEESGGLSALGWHVAIGKWIEALLVIGLAAYFILRHGTPAAAFGVRLERPLPQLGWSALTLGSIYFYLFASVLVVMIAMHLVPSIMDQLKDRVELFDNLPVIDVYLTTVLLTAVAIHEELLFRGLLLTLLRRATGAWWISALLTSVLFGVLHFPQGWLAVLQVMGISLILSVFFIVSRSIFVVILAHFLFDFIQFQIIGHVLPHFRDALEKLQNTPPG